MSEEQHESVEMWLKSEKESIQQDIATMKQVIVGLRQDLNDLVFLLYGHKDEIKDENIAQQVESITTEEVITK